MIEDWLSNYAPNAPYLVIFVVLLMTGFGLPLPEDIPLMIAGYLCGQTPGNHPHIWVMIPGCMLAILGSDVILYLLGRRFGPSIQRHRYLIRVVGNRNLTRVRYLFRKHGNKFVFFARFLPGVRAPAFFTAGSYKMPLSKFLLWDGAAAMLSVPWVLLLAWHFHDKIEWVRDKVSQGKTAGIVVVVAAVLFFLGYHLLVSKKISKVPEAKPDKPVNTKSTEPEA
ncbi:MAG: DedA family protein [Planctomycetota bacterium]